MMDEPSAHEPRPDEDTAAVAPPGAPPQAGRSDAAPSAPPGWEPPWGASGPPTTPMPVAPPPASPGQWRFNPNPTGAPLSPPAPYGPGTAHPSSVHDTGRFGTPPYAGPPQPGPYGGGPYAGGPYGGGPYGGGPYGGGPYGGGPYGGGPYGGGPYGGGPYGGGWHPGPTMPPRPASRGLVVTMVLVGVLVAALVGALVGHGLATNSGTSSVFGSGSNATSPPSGAPGNAASIAAAIDPDLVDINTVISSEEVEGAGTGMVLTSTGEILTNNHVIEEADPSQIRVTDIGNGKVYDATVVGYDRVQDVAVLQLTGASGLQTVPLGNSSGVSVGQGVVAVGNAGGVGGTPSYAGGNVVATNQTISASDEVDNSSETLTGLIESDANIMAGDSGGPLVNTSGKVIGMDTAASSGFQFANSGTQGYSIPINTAVNIARQIEAGNGSSTIHVGSTAFLGVGVVNASSSCSSFGGGGGGTGSGALVCQVVTGGPAQAAGITEQDVITGVNGQSVTSANSLTDVMSEQKPGATVSVTYVDPSGAQHTVSVTLASGAPQ